MSAVAVRFFGHLLPSLARNVEEWLYSSQGICLVIVQIWEL